LPTVIVKRYSTKWQKKRRAKQRKLTKQREVIIQSIATLPRQSLAHQEQKELLEELELEMDQDTHTKAEGLAIRAGVCWREQGESSTKYFFRLLKERKEKTTMSSLIDARTGVESQETEDMKTIGREFYKSLYSPDPVAPFFFEQFTSKIPATQRVSYSAGQRLIRPFDATSLNNVVNSSAKNKAPGMDGLPYEIYPLLMEHLPTRDLFIRVLDEALQDGSFPETWTFTCMILLFKKGDTKLLKNWRPLSLINADAVK
jgi:hypothetical protein